MLNNLYDPDFIRFCETATPLEMVTKLTGGNVRGLENLALRSLNTRRQLPKEVINVMLVYFYNTYASQVYDRNSLARLYDYWATKQVRSFAAARDMTKIDIRTILEK
jgi:replication initiation and membrane attachment protein DnaB